MATPNRDAIDTYVSITGASEPLARLKLEECGGNLNEALNAHFSERDSHSANPTFVSSPQYGAMPMNDQTQAGRHGLLPILSAVRSFRPSLLLDPNYRRNLLNRIGASASISPAPNISHPAHTGEMPVDFWSGNGHYSPLATRPGAESVSETSLSHNREADARLDADDIEKEMIQAAIEASKQEVPSHPGASQSQLHPDDDDLARVISLSIETAKEENAVRELLGDDRVQEPLVYRRGETCDKNGTKPNPGITSVQGVGVQPLLVDKPNVSQNHPQREGHAFCSDEWGGISPKELDEALMLEAAVFSKKSESLDAQKNRSVISNPQPLTCPPPTSLMEQHLLRRQQDDEYLASLLADREKEFNSSEEALTHCSKKEESRGESSKGEQLEKILVAKEASLPPEPPSDNDNAVTLLVRTPDGNRHGRRFLKTDKIQLLFDFIDVGRLVRPGTYRVVRPYPRRAFDLTDASSTLNDLGLTSKQEVLFLELI